MSCSKLAADVPNFDFFFPPPKSSSAGHCATRSRERERRRRAEADGTFRPRYRIRAGIVATNWNSNVSTGSATCAFEDDRAWSSPSI